MKKISKQSVIYSPFGGFRGLLSPLRGIGLLLLLVGAGGFTGHAQTAPLHAASTRTWTFGGQTWSDHIHLPECNKDDFKGSTSDPQCRSYTGKRKAWYYYNWPYVAAHAEKLCPSPWRVPSREDFKVLYAHAKDAGLSDVWGLPGICGGSGTLYGQGSYGNYWSASEDRSGYGYSAYVSGSGFIPQYGSSKDYGFALRCVR
ncbi:MAG: fibrobacter succinogenes major paralogous domain-containing protein [Prevotellaceae bacterium]|jgi:hypothetical protein|nr:fibrobacter succinogenes major paralogous domain-containing protein [Prevotellaceae bacterium]